ncbi:hypothetical protein LEP1GSC016_2972 [Leptospira borgpetersenii serovar Hardjo-bovis str. Sponselee]|uniref:Uncharacterized protein n=2 Tax=Leptospira borgpetersenii TaxID=174 RepID=M6BNH8_LEPBO|nr:hypothetical protein LEP1GSC016_2972 [Leptospira borgpetersenii serovar Hardjo-bovis str. Sponselee]EMO64662.1 hypothetical protein LEP1GSC133_3038 [Leptospira borgpetersenii serovar Pomona str. 200901868]
MTYFKIEFFYPIFLNEPYTICRMVRTLILFYGVRKRFDNVVHLGE